MELNNVENGFHHFGKMKIYWEKYGSGEIHILAFHGFGLRCNSFNFLSETLDMSKYTIYAIGLFCHESSFPIERLGNNPLRPTELKELVMSFSKSMRIERFILVGYSIGSRICFELALQMTQQVKGLLVVAPDGIVKNRWYSFLMSSKWLGRTYLFLLNLKFLNIFFLKTLRLVALLDEESFEIAKNQVANKKRAQRVYDTWTVYQLIFPPINDWIKLVNNKQLQAAFYFGKYDEIIGKAAVKKMKSLLSDKQQLFIIDDGHQLLKKQYAEKYYGKALKRFNMNTI